MSRCSQTLLAWKVALLENNLAIGIETLKFLFKTFSLLILLLGMHSKETIGGVIKALHIRILTVICNSIGNIKNFRNQLHF